MCQVPATWLEGGPYRIPFMSSLFLRQAREVGALSVIRNARSRNTVADTSRFYCDKHTPTAAQIMRWHKQHSGISGWYTSISYVEKHIDNFEALAAVVARGRGISTWSNLSIADRRFLAAHISLEQRVSERLTLGALQLSPGAKKASLDMPNTPHLPRLISPEYHRP